MLQLYIAIIHSSSDLRRMHMSNLCLSFLFPPLTRMKYTQALSQVVKHDEELCELSNKIGNRGEPDSMPGWPEDIESMANDPEYVPQEYMKRDVRGVCEDIDLQNRFALIADSVKKDSGLGDVISGLRVAPAGVMCMIHPLINYDDYSYVEPNQTSQIAPYYNGTKMLYADWGWGKTSRVNVLRKTMQVQEAQKNRITITGPCKYMPYQVLYVGSIFSCISKPQLQLLLLC